MLFLIKIRETPEDLRVDVSDECDIDDETDNINSVSECPDTSLDVEPQILKVESDTSPYFYAFYKHHTCHIVVDSGAESSLISKSFLKSVGISTQWAQGW